MSPEIDAASLQRLARKLQASGQPDLAVDAYQRLVLAAPDDQTARLGLADALQAAGRIDEASGIYDDLLALPVPPDWARVGKMKVHLALNEPEKVLSDYAALAAKGPVRNVPSLLCHGIALDRLGRHAEAQKSYRAALEHEPHSIAARSNLGLSLALDGKYPEAVEILRPMASSSNAPATVRQNLALVYGLMGKADLAAELGKRDLSAADVAANAAFYAALHP